MPADQLVSLAGLSVKTGRIAKGDALLPAITSSTSKLVMLSDGCGANRKKKIQDKCRFYHIPLIEIPAMRFDQISGKVNGAFAILDTGFAGKLIEIAKLQSALPQTRIQLFNLQADKKD